MLVSDSCVGAEWQGPVWVVNHSDSALGRRSGMAPVSEWPLTFSVRTEASLNNSIKRGKKIKKKKKQLGVFSSFAKPAVEPYHCVHLWHGPNEAADNTGLATGMCQEGQGLMGRTEKGFGEHQNERESIGRTQPQVCREAWVYVQARAWLVFTGNWMQIQY